MFLPSSLLHNSSPLLPIVGLLELGMKRKTMWKTAKILCNWLPVSGFCLVTKDSLGTTTWPLMFSLQPGSNCSFLRKPWGILDIVNPTQAHSFQPSHDSGPRGTPQSSWCRYLLTRGGTRRSAQVHLQFIVSIWTGEFLFLWHAKVWGQAISFLCHLFLTVFPVLKWQMGKYTHKQKSQ